jgi:hypothetical protein
VIAVVDAVIGLVNTASFSTPVIPEPLLHAFTAEDSANRFKDSDAGSWGVFTRPTPS